jgi:hypothetical protein
MPRVGFEPVTPVFEWAKTVHSLDRAVTVIGLLNSYQWYYQVYFAFTIMWTHHNVFEPLAVTLRLLRHFQCHVDRTTACVRNTVHCKSSRWQ